VEEGVRGSDHLSRVPNLGSIAMDINEGGHAPSMYEYPSPTLHANYLSEPTSFLCLSLLNSASRAISS
jgi:hypothetical protein